METCFRELGERLCEDLADDEVLLLNYSGEDSEISYIATELLTGPTLRRFAEDHPEIPAEIAACFAIAVAPICGVLR